VLSLITCVGHTIGTFMPVPAEQAEMHATIATMKATMVPMPVGAARSYMEILDGNNICTSLLLALCAALLLSVARAEKEHVVDRVIALTALALVGISLLSFRYFFPVPGVFTGLAAVLALLARARAASPA
jgi:CHASE2 domain-containing sensor protein